MPFPTPAGTDSFWAALPTSQILDVIPRLSGGLLQFDNSLKQQTSLSEPLKAEQGGFL